MPHQKESGVFMTVAMLVDNVNHNPAAQQAALGILACRIPVNRGW
jgi:hypothetical protein